MKTVKLLVIVAISKDILTTHRAISRASGQNQPKVLWPKLYICYTGSTVNQACLLHLASKVRKILHAQDFYPVIEPTRTLLPNNLLPNCCSPVK